MTKSGKFALKILTALLAVVCFAVCLSACATTYTVSFETDGGGTLSSVKVRRGETLAEPEHSLGKIGYEIDGWYTDSKFGEDNRFVFGETAVKSDLTLYVKWTKTTLTVNFDSNGGSPVESDTVFYGDKLTEPDVPNYAHFDFLGWFKNSELTEAFDFDVPVTESITLYAAWSKAEFLVVFNINGGSQVASKYVAKGMTISEPAHPEKDGYAFFGWYEDEELLNEYDFSQAVNADIELYAKWMEKVETADGFVLSPKKDGGYSVSAKEGFGFSGEVTVPEVYEGQIVDEIDEMGFFGQSSITKLIIGKSITYIGVFAFEGMTGLKELVVPFALSKSVNLFGDEIPDGLNVLVLTDMPAIISDSAALNGYENITALTIGDGAESLPSGLLAKFTRLESLTLPFIGTSLNAATGFFGSIFGAATVQLQNISVPASLKNVKITGGGICFQYAFSQLIYLESVILPEGMTVLEKNAFADCSNLNEIDLGTSLKSIADYAFKGCASLSEINIPDSVETIGAYVFDSVRLETLNLPASLSQIGYPNLIPTLTEFRISEENAYFSVSDGILYNKDKTVIVYYPIGKTAETFALPSSVTEISPYAFYCAVNLRSVPLHNGLTVVGTNAFRSSGLTSVALPSTLKTIGNTAFSTLSKLTSFTFAETISFEGDISLGRFMISSCPELTEIYVPEYVTALPDYFVSGATKLVSIEIAGVIKAVGDLAFASTGLKEISITFDDNATIGERIFYNCGGLTKFYLSMKQGATELPKLHTAGFNSFIPQIIVDPSIENQLKLDWSEYAEYIVSGYDPNKLFVINDGVLTGYLGGDDVADIVIPNTVTTIGYQAFEKKAGLKTVVIPSSVTTIYSRAFYDCSNLLYVEFGHDTGFDMEFRQYNGAAANGTVVFNNYPLILAQNPESYSKLSGYFGVCPVIIKAETSIRAGFVYSADGKSILKFRGAGEVILDSGVTSIGAAAFAGNSGLISVGLSSVQTIGKDAFVTTGLTSLTLPSSVKEIGESAFARLPLTTITFADCAAIIGISAFSDCYDLESIDFGNAIVSIGYGAFTYAGDSSGIESVILPATVENIFESAFEDAAIQTIYCRFSESRCNDFDDGNVWLDSFYNSVVWDYNG